MVERVEVLRTALPRSTAPTLPQSVVNIILRKDYSGVGISGSYDNSSKNRRWEKNFSLFAGAGSGRASATVAVSFFERGALKASDTTFGANADLSARYNNYGPQYIPLVTAGFYDLRSGTGPQARIAHRPRHRQISSRTASTSPASPPAPPSRVARYRGTAAGTLALSDTRVYQPGSTGTGGQYAAAAANTYVTQILAPQSSRRISTTSGLRVAHARVQRTGVNFTYRYDVPRTSVLRRGVLPAQQVPYRTRALAVSTAGDNNILVPRTNYWNPFGVDVSFNFRPIDIGARKADITNHSYSLLLGAKGTFSIGSIGEIGYTCGYDEVVDLPQTPSPKAASAPPPGPHRMR